MYNDCTNNNLSYINKFRLHNTNLNHDINQKIHKFNDISLNNYILFDKIIPLHFYINNLIDNISQNNYKLFNSNNSIGKEEKGNFEKYNLLKKNYKEITNKIKSYKIKRNIFKVITKISRYKGVSKNKKNWQVYIRINNKNTYLGSYKDEKFAAKIYDLMSIKKKGKNAKTNFKYSNKQIKKISKLKFDIYNIYKIASKKDI